MKKLIGIILILSILAPFTVDAKGSYGRSSFSSSSRSSSSFKSSSSSRSSSSYSTPVTSRSYNRSSSSSNSTTSYGGNTTKPSTGFGSQKYWENRRLAKEAKAKEKAKVTPSASSSSLSNTQPVIVNNRGGLGIFDYIFFWTLFSNNDKASVPPVIVNTGTGTTIGTGALNKPAEVKSEGGFFNWLKSLFN